MRNTYDNAKEIEANDIFVYITGRKPINGAQNPYGLSFHEIESIRKQRFLGPLRLFAEDYVFPDWKYMVKPTENFDTNACEICRYVCKCKISEENARLHFRACIQSL